MRWLVHLLERKRKDLKRGESMLKNKSNSKDHLDKNKRNLKDHLDKNKGNLGNCDLNLADYGEKEFKYLKIALQNCEDKDAYIEVGIKNLGGETTRRTKPEKKQDD